MNPYKIVTDATVDMSAELEKELDIHILPMEVEVDGQPFTFSQSTNPVRSRQHSLPVFLCNDGSVPASYPSPSSDGSA